MFSRLSMAVRQPGALYSPAHGGTDMSTEYAAYHSSTASVGGNNPYRYSTHARSADPPPLDYYAEEPDVVLTLTHAWSTTIRQPTLPRLQIPSPASLSPLDSQRGEPTFHSASTTHAKSHPPPFRGPLSAPESSQDFRYQRASNMQAAGGDEGDAQKPTRTRRTTTTAVIACQQCRARKIRCDSTRPHCSNCSRRADECHYDPAPKRRGPDKKPGTRQRRCKKRPEEEEGEEVPLRRPSVRLEPSPSTSASMIALPSPAPMPSPESASAPVPPASLEDQDQRPRKRQRVGRDSESQDLEDLADGAHQQQHPPVSSHSYGRAIRPLLHIPPHPLSPSSQNGPLRISTDESVLLRQTQQPSSAQPPSSEVSSSQYGTTPLSTSYAYDVSPFARSGYDLGPPQQSAMEREHPKFPSLPSTSVQAAQQGWWEAFLRSYSLREIATDLNFLYNETSISLSFVNVGFLLETLWSPTKYLTLQPAFILASMALAILIRSSEAERGAAGRERAGFLRHSAQEALERAWREGVWLDASLAEAALIIVLYESSAHPEYHPDRLARALGFLDEVLSVLGLTALDAGSADVCRYGHGAAPVVDVPPGAQCACVPPRDRDSVYASALPWDPRWDAREIRDEECRRLCWCALALATSFRTECMALARVDACAGLRLCDPASYLVLFPNEMYDRGGLSSGRDDGRGGTHPKNAIWALYCRSMLLANFCANVVARSAESHEDREGQGEALQESWNEAQAIQDALDAHVCNLHTAVAYLCRENISNAQMIVTKGLRSLQGLPAGNRPGPLFNRRQAQEWIYYQAEVIKRVTLSVQYLADPRGQQLTQRPFSVTWFYHQLAICLLLWENDTSLGEVLELAKSFLIPLDVMNTLWPCDLIQRQYAVLRKRLTAHCRSAGHDAPPPSAPYALPPAPRAS
ncbi:hypothetical protein DFH07DRAFT_911882 [Mycena maculata]|uniref:Zn(2)-C6 fungal-type domain-containing protein n=1 Tax=Mycena maculata TaxID=230809 RepID=A0AAD7K6C1_9AGAR|nr:hypothetical protein DFH07DRAFT_911882 [Mycena maculata]